MKEKRKYAKKSPFWNSNDVLVNVATEKINKSVDICSLIPAEILIAMSGKKEKTICLPDRSKVIRRYLAEKLANTQFLCDMSKELKIKDEEIVSAISG